MGPEDENSNPLLQLNLRANISDVTEHMPSTSHELEDVNILHLMCMQC